MPSNFKFLNCTYILKAYAQQWRWWHCLCLQTLPSAPEWTSTHKCFKYHPWMPDNLPSERVCLQCNISNTKCLIQTMCAKSLLKFIMQTKLSQSPFISIFYFLYLFFLLLSVYFIVFLFVLFFERKDSNLQPGCRETQLW